MSLSPMMKHYLEMKEKHKDCILFYRLGDFYEMFFEDAKKASQLLDLTLTGKDCGLQDRAPMCGIPFHAAEGYIQKLVSLGEKVAICEQLTEATAGRGLVERDVIRIVSAGTQINEELIDSKSNNFLASVCLQEDCSAISWVDITTGEFFCKQFSGEKQFSNIIDDLVKISPAEIISNVKGADIFNKIPLVIHGVLPKFSAFTESEYSYSRAKDTLLNQFNLLTLSSFGLDDKKAIISSAGALISYLRQTQKHALVNIHKISLQNSNDIMMLDINAIRNLELTKTLRDGKRHGTLLWLLDKTKTGMGGRKLQSLILSPLYNVDLINKRLDGVESFVKNNLLRNTVSETISCIRDISRISGKLSNGNLCPRDCLALKTSLEVLPNLKFQLSGINTGIITDICNKIKDFSQIVKLIGDTINEDCPPTVKDGNYIKKGYSKELDQLKELSHNSKSIIASIENRERERTGVKNLKIGYNRVFGYFIELTNSFKDKAPYDYQRKQTLVGAERFVTDELKEIEQKILSSDEKSIRLEAEIFKQVKNVLTERIEDFEEASEAIAELDVLLSFATVSVENNYVRPTLNDKLNLSIIQGRHPVVEAVSSQQFVPNDCMLDGEDNRIMILTGPNMAGKSTYMRQVALITLMAHIGCFVPAKEANIPLTDKIFTRIGASDNLISDQSTFMVEMTEMASILSNATKNSLLILDEIGRGTSTYDGLSIAWAIVEDISKNIKAKTMFATHYHELTNLEGTLDGVKNYKVSVKEFQDNIVFLRKIMRGVANRSFGIEVSELAGINKNITNRAKEILKSLEQIDISNGNSLTYENETKQQTDIERVLKDLNINSISPLEALMILSDLKEKVKE